MFQFALGHVRIFQAISRNDAVISARSIVDGGPDRFELVGCTGTDHDAPRCLQYSYASSARSSSLPSKMKDDFLLHIRLRRALGHFNVQFTELIEQCSID